MNRLLEKYSIQLLDAINWQGVGMVEFKWDAEEKEFKLLEINGRFWGSLQLAIDSGVNFPRLAVQISQNEKIKKNLQFNTRVRTRWLWGDFDSLIMRLFSSHQNENLPPGYPSKMQCFRDFFRLSKINLNFEILKKNDIKPWIYETHRWFKKAFDS